MDTFHGIFKCIKGFDALKELDRYSWFFFLSYLFPDILLYYDYHDLVWKEVGSL